MHLSHVYGAQNNLLLFVNEQSHRRCSESPFTPKKGQMEEASRAGGNQRSEVRRLEGGREGGDHTPLLMCCSVRNLQPEASLSGLLLPVKMNLVQPHKTSGGPLETTTRTHQQTVALLSDCV